MITTAYETISFGQQFRTIDNTYAALFIYAEDGTREDRDIISADLITFEDHGDEDGQLVKVEFEDGTSERGILRLDGWTKVERVLPETNLTFVPKGHPYLASHNHRSLHGYRVCDDTATYWA